MPDKVIKVFAVDGNLNICDAVLECTMRIAEGKRANFRRHNLYHLDYVLKVEGEVAEPFYAWSDIRYEFSPGNLNLICGYHIYMVEEDARKHAYFGRRLTSIRQRHKDAVRNRTVWAKTGGCYIVDPKKLEIHSGYVNFEFTDALMDRELLKSSVFHYDDMPQMVYDLGIRNQLVLTWFNPNDLDEGKDALVYADKTAADECIEFARVLAGGLI